MHRHSKSVIIIIFLLVTIIYSQTLKIAIIPFTINAEEDLFHLQDGISDLLSARLSKQDTLIVIHEVEVVNTLKTIGKLHGESLALIVGAKLNVQYVVYGSLTASGTNISILAKMVDVSGDKPPVAFSKHVQDREKIIPEINLFATDIKRRILYKEIDTENEDNSTPPQLVIKQNQPAKDTLETDEKKKETPKQGINLLPSKNDSINPFFKKLWKSRNFKLEIIGLTVGDINNDNKNDIVILTPEMVQMFRFVDGKLLKVKDIYRIRDRYPVGMDIADINKNGTPEIFVTCLDHLQSRVSSFALEFNGKEYKRVAKNIRYYLRAVQLKDSTKVLFGQVGSTEGPFKGKISKLKHEDSKYIPDSKLMPSKKTSVLGLTYGDIMNNNRDIVVAYNEFDYINVYNSVNKKVWTSRFKKYGGSTRFFKPFDEEKLNKNNEYLPIRIIMKDIDSDGQQEVITADNFDATARLIGKFRYFYKSNIVIMSWDINALMTEYATKKISGAIRDFAIDDIDNDGKVEFIAGMIHKEGKTAFSKPLSSIIVYELQ